MKKTSLIAFPVDPEGNLLPPVAFRQASDRYAFVAGELIETLEHKKMESEDNQLMAISVTFLLETHSIHKPIEAYILRLSDRRFLNILPRTTKQCIKTHQSHLKQLESSS